MYEMTEMNTRLNTMLLSTGQAAKRLGVTRGTVLNWIKAGHIKALKIGPKVYKIEEKEVERLLCN